MSLYKNCCIEKSCSILQKTLHWKKFLNITKNIAVKKLLNTVDSRYLEHIWVEFPDKSNLIYEPFAVIANHIYYSCLKFLVKSKILTGPSKFYITRVNCIYIRWSVCRNIIRWLFTLATTTILSLVFQNYPSFSKNVFLIK